MKQIHHVTINKDVFSLLIKQQAELTMQAGKNITLAKTCSHIIAEYLKEKYNENK